MGLAALGQTVLESALSPGMDLADQGMRVLQKLGPAPVLLIYDNARSIDAIQPWLPSAGIACHVIITTLLDLWDRDWRVLHVPPLSHSASLTLIARTASPTLADRYGERLATVAEGLPFQLVPSCSALVYEEKRGRTASALLSMLSSQAQNSFLSVYRLLSTQSRLLMHAAARLNPQRIPIDELRSHVTPAVGWSGDEFQDYLDECLDLQVLQGIDELRIFHQLFAQFVFGMPASEEIAEHSVSIARAQIARMIEVAGQLVEHPSRADLAVLLMVYSPDPSRWCRGEIEVSVSDGETVGRALAEVGAFDAARPWFERAVAAAEKGDVHGRVDHASLGRSLHQVGYCLSSTGGFDAARPWFERAVAAAEKGDVHGRVDHESLGNSLLAGAVCLRHCGHHQDAEMWEARAAQIKQILGTSETTGADL
jgi:hypothetical protein